MLFLSRNYRSNEKYLICNKWEVKGALYVGNYKGCTNYYYF